MSSHFFAFLQELLAQIHRMTLMNHRNFRRGITIYVLRLAAKPMNGASPSEIK